MYTFAYNLYFKTAFRHRYVGYLLACDLDITVYFHLTLTLYCIRSCDLDMCLSGDLD